MTPLNVTDPEAAPVSSSVAPGSMTVAWLRLPRARVIFPEISSTVDELLITPSPLRSWCSTVSIDFKDALVPDALLSRFEVKLPLLSVVHTVYSPVEVFFQATS